MYDRNRKKYSIGSGKELYILILKWSCHLNQLPKENADTLRFKMANLKEIKELGGEIAAIKLQISKMAGQGDTKTAAVI